MDTSTTDLSISSRKRSIAGLDWRALWIPALVAILLFAGFFNLDRTPPPGWDEGWTLTVARTWVEQGFYGRLLDGEPAAPGLEAALPTTGSVALAFRLLGVGLWQARLVGVLFTFADAALLFFLASQVYGRRTAWATLAVAFLMSMHPYTNPIVNGRQVLAEPEMLFFLLGGYAAFLLALRLSLWWMPLACFFWGTSLIAKAQTMPFWALSLIVPAAVLLLKHRWQIVAWLLAAIAGSYVGYLIDLRLLALILTNHVMPRESLVGLYDVLAFVPILADRLRALSTTLWFEVPLLLGLSYAVWRALRDWRELDRGDVVDAVRMGLLTVSISWLAWFVLLGNGGIPRYLYPPTFVGSPFVALLLRDLTDGFDIRGTLARAAHGLGRYQLDGPSLRALVAVLLVALALPVTLFSLFWFYVMRVDTSAQQTAQFLDVRMGSNQLVETYDTELFFFLNRPYHYPTDQTHVELIHRMLDPKYPVHYEPLSANPDYLVVGPMSLGWHVYDDVLAAGSFRSIQRIGEYRIYERVR